MSGIESLLRVARAYALAEDIEMKTVSWRVFGDSKKLSAIEAGRDIQLGRFENAMQWFSDNWPQSAVWPCGVARPERSEAAA